MTHDLVWSDDAPDARIDPHGEAFEHSRFSCRRCRSRRTVFRSGYDRQTEQYRPVNRCLDCGWYRYQGPICQRCLGEMVEAERIGSGNIYGPGGAESIRYECDDCGWSETRDMDPRIQV